MIDNLLKRAFDIIISLSGILLSFPIWIIIGILIWFEDKGPVFYIQDRVGKNGILFKGIKFRSMVFSPDEPEKTVQASEHDARVTKIGSFLRITAMDELPQLINILKGDMSFVGPRALAPKEKEISGKTEESIFDIPGFKERSTIRPGLTGVAQFFAPRDIDRKTKFKYDAWYIKNKSFFLDIYLIILSFMVTFCGKWETRYDKLNIFGAGLKKRIEEEVAPHK